MIVTEKENLELVHYCFEYAKEILEKPDLSVEDKEQIVATLDMLKRGYLECIALIYKTKGAIAFNKDEIRSLVIDNNKQQ